MLESDYDHVLAADNLSHVERHLQQAIVFLVNTSGGGGLSVPGTIDVMQQVCGIASKVQDLKNRELKAAVDTDEMLLRNVGSGI